jgi:hypothetical protein
MLAHILNDEAISPQRQQGRTMRLQDVPCWRCGLVLSHYFFESGEKTASQLMAALMSKNRYAHKHDENRRRNAAASKKCSIGMVFAFLPRA